MARNLTLIAALSLAGCAALGPDVVARLGSDPVLSGGSFDSGGGLTVAVDLREFEGRTMVCGVWAQSPSSRQSALTKHKARGVVDSGAILVNGATIVRGLNFLPEVDPSDSYAGAPAGCRVTDRAWRNADVSQRPVIRIPRQVVHVENDEMGGFTILFRQDGPGA